MNRAPPAGEVPAHRQPATAAGAAPPDGHPVDPPLTPLSERVASVDALRGFDIFCIIGGDGVALSLRDMLSGHGTVLSAIGNAIGTQFEHVAWEGLHFYDLIFPLFLFLTGVAIAFALPRLVEREGMTTAHWRIVRRFLLLFLLGFVYYGGVRGKWPDVRLLGVLQRIALCYLATSLMFLHMRRRGLIAAFAVLVGGYWALLTFVPVPGGTAGSYTLDGNLASWIDLQLVPGRHFIGTLEPEGLLSTLPAIGTCLLGIFAGQLLEDPRLTPPQRTLWLAGGGLALLAAGLVWSPVVPIVKSIWTSSYVLVTGGLCVLLLGVFYQVIDVWKCRGWATIFIWIGANALALYVINNLVKFKHIANRLVGGDVGAFLDLHLARGAGQFAANALGLALAVGLAGFLYRRKILIRV